MGPILEALQAEINFGESKMRLLHQEWRDAPRGRQGAMLLRMAAEVKHPEDFEEPVFDFRCEDGHDKSTNLHESQRSRALLRDDHRGQDLLLAPRP